MCIHNFLCALWFKMLLSIEFQIKTFLSPFNNTSSYCLNAILKKTFLPCPISPVPLSAMFFSEYKLSCFYFYCPCIFIILPLSSLQHTYKGDYSVSVPLPITNFISKMLSSSLHVAPNCINLSFLMTKQCSIVFIYHSYFFLFFFTFVLGPHLVQLRNWLCIQKSFLAVLGDLMRCRGSKQVSFMQVKCPTCYTVAPALPQNYCEFCYQDHRGENTFSIFITPWGSIPKKLNCWSKCNLNSQIFKTMLILFVSNAEQMDVPDNIA